MSDKVLLVDDDLEVLEGFERALANEPYELFTAESAKAAIQILAHEDIDVIVSDERMPGQSGSEFLTWARHEYPDTIRIMLTGHADVESAMRAIYGGWVYQYLHKPISTVDLADAIRNGLVVKQTQQGKRPSQVLMTADQQAALLEKVSAHKMEEMEKLQRMDRWLESEPPAAYEAPAQEVIGVIEEIKIALDRLKEAATAQEVIDELRKVLERIEYTENPP